MNFTKQFNFNEITDFKKLDDCGNLLEYIQDLENEINYSEQMTKNISKLYVSENKYKSLDDISKKDFLIVNGKAKLNNYKYYYINIFNRNLIANQYKYLKVLKERETELIEYLNSLDEIKEFI